MRPGQSSGSKSKPVWLYACLNHRVSFLFRVNGVQGISTQAFTYKRASFSQTHRLLDTKGRHHASIDTFCYLDRIADLHQGRSRA